MPRTYFQPKSSSLLIEKINREFFPNSHSPCIKKNVFEVMAEVEPLNLELDSVNQFSFFSLQLWSTPNINVLKG